MIRGEGRSPDARASRSACSPAQTITRSALQRGAVRELHPRAAARCVHARDRGAGTDLASAARSSAAEGVRDRHEVDDRGLAASAAPRPRARAARSPSARSPSNQRRPPTPFSLRALLQSPQRLELALARWRRRACRTPPTRARAPRRTRAAARARAGTASLSASLACSRGRRGRRRCCARSGGARARSPSPAGRPRRRPASSRPGAPSPAREFHRRRRRLASCWTLVA